LRLVQESALVVVRKNSIRAIGAEYEHESHGMMSA
jgi:hypothetical protein